MENHLRKAIRSIANMVTKIQFKSDEEKKELLRPIYAATNELVERVDAYLDQAQRAADPDVSNSSFL